MRNKLGFFIRQERHVKKLARSDFLLEIIKWSDLMGDLKYCAATLETSFAEYVRPYNLCALARRQWEAGASGAK